MRRVAVIGLGNFGSHFAKGLIGTDLDLLAIDTSEETVNRIAEFVPRAVVADATDRRILEEIGVGNADIAVVSLGGRMDASIIVVLHLRSLGVAEICVKAISDDHARILELIGATRIIHPEREVAEQLAHGIAHPSVMKYLPLMGDYAIVELATPPEFVGKTLPDLHLRRDHQVNVIAVSPAGDPKRLQAPSVDTPLAKGSLLVLIGEKRDLESFQRKFCE